MTDDFREIDEYRNKNLYSTYEEIDQRQVLELAGLLDRWASGETAPWHVIREATGIMGVIAYGCTDSLYDSSQVRPEVMRHDPVILENIGQIKQMIAGGEFDSWAVAQAIAEVVFVPDPEEDPGLGWEVYLDRRGRKSLRTRFLEGLERSKKECEPNKKDWQKTVDLLRPETEAEIKKSLAAAFAKATLRREEKALHEKHRQERGANASGGAGNTPMTDDEYYQKIEELNDRLYEIDAEEGEIPEFASPLDLPDQKICNGIYITPAGAALIEPYERGEYWEPSDSHLYGDSVARITTYQISFAPTKPEHLDALAKAVEDGLAVFKDIPYKYEIPDAYFTRTSKAAYQRPPYAGSAYVSKSDGKATVYAKLDLDDLWVLYYLLEPIIEPNKQIATAMNMARYAEERGAILDPDALDYLNAGHDIADKSGALQLVSPEEVLETAVRDAFVDYALNKIDEAQFIARVAVIGGHTLSGNMQDPQGRFVTQDLLPDNRGGNGTKALEPREILSSRVNELVKLVVGESTRPGETILEALMRTKARITDPLREHFRSQEKQDRIELRKAISTKLENDMKRLTEKGLEETLKAADEKAAFIREEEKEESTQLSRVTQLVVQESQVETQMDGLYADGRYRTKTKGSLLVRKELPAALMPFIRDPGGMDHIRKLSEPVMRPQ